MIRQFRNDMKIAFALLVALSAFPATSQTLNSEAAQADITASQKAQSVNLGLPDTNASEIRLPPSQPAAETNTIASEADVRKLIAVSGGVEMFRGVISQYKEQLQKIRPDVPAEFWEAFFTATNLNDMIELAIPVYQKHFSRSEIEQMIAIKESPIGRKMALEMPEIAKELAIAGQKWGEGLGEKLQSQLQATKPKSPRPEENNPPADPTDRPSFRVPTAEESKFLASRGVDVSHPNTRFLTFPKEMTDTDTSQSQKTTEQNVYGSWRMWNAISQPYGYNETTITFLPGGKMNYLVTTAWTPESITVLTGKVSYSDNVESESQVYAGTWKLAGGYISYDVTNFVSTAEKVVSLSAKRLTCVSGVNGETYIMYRVSP
jgi:uncharacterized protein